jgi:prolyl 4-hydroxylase
MIQEVKKFIDEDTCDRIIELSLEKLRPARVLSGTSSTESIHRTADYTWIENQESELVTKIKDKICEMINISPEKTEDLHIVRYNIGGEFKEHFDFFIPQTDYYDNCMNRGGQRTHSIIIYLNDDFEGGETYFPRESVKIKPEKGKLVMWSNITEDGRLDFDKLHSGLPITSGTKYIATIWVREKEFPKNLLQSDY